MGLTGIFLYSYSSVPLHKKMVREIIFLKLQLQLQKCTGPEGERGGEMREKGWEERGPKAHSKNSDFSTPLI